MTSRSPLLPVLYLLTTSQPSSPGTEGSGSGGRAGAWGSWAGSEARPLLCGRPGELLRPWSHLCVSDGRDAVLRPLVQRLQQDLGGRGKAAHSLGCGPPSPAGR